MAIGCDFRPKKDLAQCVQARLVHKTRRLQSLARCTQLHFNRHRSRSTYTRVRLVKDWIQYLNASVI